MTFNARNWNEQPPLIDAGYKSTTLRGPKQKLVPIKQTLSEITGPTIGATSLNEHDSDLTKNSGGNSVPIGERIIVAGRVLGDNGKPVANSMIEIIVKVYERY